MRLPKLLLLVLIVRGVTAQDQPTTRSCPPNEKNAADVTRLQRLLREKGVDALVQEVMRPQREFWDQLKSGLVRQDGSRYFSKGVQGALLPEMSGFLLSQNGPELLLSMSDANVEEITLKLEAPIGYTVQAGTRVMFRGVATDFLPQPFKFVISAKLADVSFFPPPNRH